MNPGPKEFTSGDLRGGEVDFSVLGDGNTGGTLRLKVIQDAVVAETERRENDFGKPAAVDANKVYAGFKSRFPGASQDRCGHGAAGWIGLIQAIEEQEVAEMEDARFALGEIKVGGIEKRVGAALMKKGASAGGLYRHHVGVGRRCRLSDVQLPDVDLMREAILSECNPRRNRRRRALRRPRKGAFSRRDRSARCGSSAVAGFLRRMLTKVSWAG